PEKGWTAGLTLAGMIPGAIALVAFVLWELRTEHPLLQIRLFSNRTLATGSLILLVVFAVMFGIFLTLTLFMQTVLGYSALASAAALLPMIVVMMPLSAIAPVISTRIGLRNTLIAGVGLFAAGL